MKRDRTGQFEAETESAATWTPKDREQYAALLDKYPGFWARKKMLAMVAQGNTKTTAMIRAGLFPRAVLRSPMRWREADVRAWLMEAAA